MILSKGVGLTSKNFLHFVSPLKKNFLKKMLMFKEGYIHSNKDFLGSRIETFVSMFVWGITYKDTFFHPGVQFGPPSSR